MSMRINDVARSARSRGARRPRGGLFIGTSLTGAAAMLLVGSMPAQAGTPMRLGVFTRPAPPMASPTGRAAPASRDIADALPRDLTVRRDEAPAGRPNPRRHAGAGVTIAPSSMASAAIPVPAAAVRDLTVSGGPSALPPGDVTVAEGTIVTTADYAPGIATATTGATTITADGISTAGLLSDGIHAAGYGAIGIDVGTVATGGAGSTGIYAQNNVGGQTGGITINAGDVRTAGEGAMGILASSYGGDTHVTTGSVHTGGYRAGGIYAGSFLGNATVTAGTVETSGAFSRGIVAVSGGLTNVTADSVTTTGGATGPHVNSTGIMAIGTSVDVEAGSVSTSGDFAAGIFAQTNYVTDNGQPSHDIHVAAGSVTTAGLAANGIEVRNAGLGGNTVISADTIKTSGDGAYGVGAITRAGNATIDIGRVTTSGNGAVGVYSYAGGGRAAGFTNRIDVESVSTGGADAAGIVALSIGDRHKLEINAGSIATTGNAAPGIIAITAGRGNKIDLHAGTVSTKGDYSYGIAALSYGVGGKINISVEDVSTDGRFATGVFAGTDDADISISADKVRTTSYGGFGILASSNYGNVTIDAHAVETDGFGSAAMNVNGQTVSVKADSIVTHGNISSGIRVFGTDDASVVANSVLTNGIFSNGIAVGGGHVSITANNVETNGYGSLGILGISYARDGSTDINVTGSVKTTGTYSDAITGVSQGAVNIRNDGVALTTGTGSTGIYSIAVGDVTLTGKGHVETEGYASRGVVAFSIAGNVSVSQSSVTTAGVRGTGVTAAILGDDPRTGTGDITIDVDKIITSGARANGIIAYNAAAGDISIKTGTVSVAGMGAQGIYAVATNGAVTVTAGTIETRGNFDPGDYYTPFSRPSGITAYAHDVTIAADKVSTAGDFAYGVKAVAFGGQASIAVGSASATGDYAEGIRVVSYGGADVKAGAVTATGSGAHGVVVGAAGKAAVTISGPLTVTGDKTLGVFAQAGGDVSVKTGGVSATGFLAGAIRAVSTGGSTSVEATGDVIVDGLGGTAIVAAAARRQRGDRDTERADEPAEAAMPSVTVKAGRVVATGDASGGIFATNLLGGNVAIQADSVSTSGRGIVATSSGDAGRVEVTVGSVASDGNAVYAQAGGDTSITVTGAIRSSRTTALIANSLTGDTTINIGAKGDVTGSGTAHDGFDGYYGDGVTFYTSHGTATLNNAGKVSTTGGGFAVHAMDFAATRPDADARAVINNSGTIVGAISLTNGDDIVTSTGLFVATKDSDFGGGADVFRNGGTLAIAGAGAAGVRAAAGSHVTLLGLERFENSGLIELRNGVAGDTLTLPGAYVGTGKALLGIDIAASGAADTLDIQGAAAGRTSILLGTTAAGAVLMAKPVTIVRAGQGQPLAADSFTLADPDIGFVAYGLRLDAASNSLQLMTAPGAAVYRLAQANAGARAVWRQSSDAWSSHMAELRDLGAPASRLWGQSYGRVETRRGERLVAGPGGGGTVYGVGYRQDYYGGQIGVDLAARRTASGGGAVLGVTGGYVSSHLNLRAGPERLRFDALNLGGYAALRAGPLFANLLGQYVHYRTHARNAVDGWSDGFGGHGYGVQGEIGARLGDRGLFIEPVAALAWQKTDLGTLHALGQSLAFDRDAAIDGKLGLRVGGTTALGGTARAVFYGRVNYVHAFRDRSGLSIDSGGVDGDVAGIGAGDRGEGAVGVNFLTAGRVSGFIEGTAEAGRGTRGAGGRIGLRIAL